MLENKQELIFKSGELIPGRGDVDNQDEGGSDPPRIIGAGGGGFGVLDGAVGGEKLGGEIGVADVGVGVREGVLVEAEGAEPDARGVVDAGVGVQNGAALGAGDGVVGEYRELGLLHQRRAHDAQGDE